MEEKINGNFIVIGGAEDKEGGREILKRVCNSINKDEDIILISTIATEFPMESLRRYKKVFSELGVRKIENLHIENREDSFKETNSELIRKAALVFFTGGDQLRITSLIGGTPVFNELKRVIEDGGIVVGTSAGASVMSDTMIVQGDDEESPRKCTLNMAPGLGFLENIIIDQHFAQRGRIGRLLTGIAQNPEVLGVGIDEDTAIVVVDKGIAEVIGNGAVYFVDGSKILYSNVSEQHSDEILSMFNVKLHVLKDGDKFNFLTRVPFKEGMTKYESDKN